MSDPHRLGRFVTAQDAHGTYDGALRELRAGRKRSHWMWFVFPQVAGLGRSAMAQEFAIASRAEAEAYLAHPVLGPRLLECTRALLGHGERSAEEVMGGIDALKLRSSMTLWTLVDPGEPALAQVLAQWYDGERDPETVRRL